MKSKFCFFILIFFIEHNYSQTNDVIDNKYLSAIVYLKTNKNIANKVCTFYNKWGKDKKIKKKEIIEFNISKYIKFLPIQNFEKEGCLDPKSYYKKHYFKFEENLFF